MMTTVRKSELELRKVLAKTLQKLMTENREVVYLEGDLAGAIGTDGLFAAFPEQAFDVGIMEANMVGAAAGMSIRGKIPFVHSFGTFASRRCADQVFLSGCYNHANVRVLGSDPGVTAEANGGTHMPFEDMATFCAYPQMTILDIAEPQLLQFVLEQSAKTYGMYYIRFPRKGNTAYYAENETFEIGKGKLLREGSDVTLVASGVEVPQALAAAELLAADGISAEVLDMFTVKPIDETLVCASAGKTGAVVTAENHSVNGGLGSAVAAVLAENLPVPMYRIGVREQFGEVGDAAYLSCKFGIDAQAIADAARKTVARKLA